MYQLTLYNAARPPPGPPELRRLRSLGRVPPPGILRRFRPARNRAGSGPFCILHSAFFLSPIRPPVLRPQRLPRRLPPEGGEPGTPPSGGRWIAPPRQPPHALRNSGDCGQKGG